MNYRKEDYAKLRYNALALNKGDKLDFADIPNYDEFKKCPKGIDKALLFKWIVFMYDTNSPYRDITDTTKRAIMCGTDAGFPKRGKLFTKEYGEVVTFSNEIITELGKWIVRYCRLQRDPAYMQLMVYENLRAANNLRLMNPMIEVKDMKALIDAQTTITSAIEDSKEMFLNGDSTEKTYEEVLDAIENEGMEFTPEQIIMNEDVRNAIKQSSEFGKYKWTKFKYSDLTEEEKTRLEKELANETTECETHFEALNLDYVGRKNKNEVDKNVSGQ